MQAASDIMAEAPEPMMAAATEAAGRMKCFICMEDKKLCLLPCGHRLCYVCIGKAMVL